MSDLIPKTVLTNAIKRIERRLIFVDALRFTKKEKDKIAVAYNAAIYDIKTELAEYEKKRTAE